MFKKTAIGVALFALAGCETANEGLTISPEALARADTLSAEVIAPRVSNSVIVQTFDAYCGRYAGNPAGTRRAVQANGYFLLGSGTADGLEMWASENERPLVATGRRGDTKVCMVMFADNPNLGAEVGRYVTQKHGNTAMSMGSMQVGLEMAENVYIVPSNPPIIYFTLLQNQPSIGQVEAFAIVTE